MDIYAVDEYNADGHLIYSSNYIGAYARGKTREEAIKKLPEDAARCRRWLGLSEDKSEALIHITQEKLSTLRICDADSDVLFSTELPPLTDEEYRALRGLALRSAADFEALYRALPLKDAPASPPR